MVMKVRQGETVELPFGPPYRPVVKTTAPLQPGEITLLQLVLVGSGGEICTDLQVEGKKPSAPVFTITAPEGEVVEQGEFEYG